MQKRDFNRAALAGVLALFVSTTAAAERWVAVAGAGPDALYLDLEGVVEDGETATIWLRTKFSVPRKKGAASSLEKWMFDCAHSQVKLLAVTMYKADGSVVGSGESPRYWERWEDVPPRSSLAVVHERVCDALNGVKGSSQAPVAKSY